jgi:GH25 family lysozyme M1 (1,4-beta-N-acetylmuramidase)
MSARLPRAVALCALIASLLVTTTAPPTTAATGLRGIDVSKWQGAIDWPSVAAAGIDFAIIKATSGQGRGGTYPETDDPMFTANVAGASANGMVVGMYHVWTPRLKDGSADVADARAEADHFLDVAAPDVRNLIPALDMEMNRIPTGMRDEPKELLAWARAWLSRVNARLGVRSMVYGSPSMFTNLLDDTSWFADHRYPLWIAHWNVSSPIVPANGWQGMGWTFWQWTHKPGLPGVDGDLDRDRFAGANLIAAEISRLTVHVGAGGSVADGTGHLTCAAGTSCDALYDPAAMVTLTATPDPGAVFLSWGGRCAAAGSSPTCVATVLGKKQATATFGYPLTTSRAGPGTGTVTSSPAGVACPSACSHAFAVGSTVALTAAPDAASEFDSWGGACSGLDPSSCSVTMDQPETVTATFADLGPPTVDITPPTTLGGRVRFAFSEPVHGIDATDLLLKVAGGPKVPTSRVCRDADGERVSCGAGPVLRATLRPSEPLIAGQSYVTVANPNGASTTIVDRAANALPTTPASFRAATEVQETAPGIAFRWGTRADARASGGSYVFEHRVGAAATFSVTGSTVTLWTAAGPGFGDTRIEVDGEFRTRLHGHRSSFTLVPHTFTGLGRGAHTLTAIVLASASGGHTGTGIDTIADAAGARSRPATTTAGWGSVTAAQADGGRYRVTGVAGAQTTLRFRGTAISLRTVTGRGFGTAQIWIDGSLVRPHFDVSAPTTTVGVIRTFGGLTDTVHTIRVVVLGIAGKDGSGTDVAVDGWLVA